jgi:hypothetical protein
MGTNQMNCQADGATWDPVACNCNYSPLLIQLTAGARYPLSGIEDGVMFDYRGDGVKRQTAWTLPMASEAFLAMDRNANGQVDSGAELFGNFTRLHTGQNASNGFEALAELDGTGAARDGVINNADTAYYELRLWLDKNHNGVSEPDELSRLDDAGLTVIELAYGRTGRRDSDGNRLLYKSRAFVDMNGVQIPRTIYDVFFATHQ